MAEQLNRITAALLAFILGGFGAHKFYLGDNRKGILYLLLFWTFIPMILGIIAAIKFFGMSDSEWNRYVSSINK